VNSYKRRSDSDGEDPSGREPGQPTIGLLRPDRVSLLIALVLAVVVGIYTYLNNMALQVREQAFVLAVFYVVVHGVRWATRRGHGRR
jgi:hypothetical protein